MSLVTSHAAVVSAVRRARLFEAEGDMPARSEAIGCAIGHIVCLVCATDVSSSPSTRHLVELYFTCAAALEEARRDPRSSGLARATVLLAPLGALEAA